MRDDLVVFLVSSPGLLGNIESFPLWTHSARPPDQGRGWVGKVPLVKDLGFETIDEKLRGGSHPLCNRSGPLVILGLAFSRNGLRTKYPASRPSHFLTLSLSLRKESSGRPSQPRLPFSASLSPSVPMGYLPGPVRQQYPVQCTYSPGHSMYRILCMLGVCGFCASAGPRAQAYPTGPPPARLSACQACLLPITLRRRG